VNERFENWEYPEIGEGKPTKDNWVVQHVDRFELGYKSQMGPCGLVRKDILANRLEAQDTIALKKSSKSHFCKEI
jgi:hypothetical protein